MLYELLASPANRLIITFPSVFGSWAEAGSCPILLSCTMFMCVSPHGDEVWGQWPGLWTSDHLCNNLAGTCTPSHMGYTVAPPDFLTWQEPWAVPASPGGRVGREVQGVSQTSWRFLVIGKEELTGQGFLSRETSCSCTPTMQSTQLFVCSAKQTAHLHSPLAGGASCSPTLGISPLCAPRSWAGRPSWRPSSASATSR